MDLTSYAPAARQHGLLTWEQALAAGLDPREVQRLVRSGSWVRLRKGVYTDAASWSALDPWRDQPLLRVRAADLVLTVDGAYSHDSAALVHGLGVPDARTALVHRTREGVRGGRAKAGIKHHGAAYRPGQVVQLDGLAVLDRARTAVDMAREHGLAAGMAACDRALRLGTPRSELAAAANAMRSWPGRSAIDRAVELADPGAESWLESLARELLIRIGRGRPETQFGLTDGGRTVFCDLRIGRHMVEADGFIKYPIQLGTRNATEVLWNEKKRQDFITGFGCGVSRVTAHDCHDGQELAVRRLAREVAATEARFGHDIADLTPYTVRRALPPGAQR